MAAYYEEADVVRQATLLGTGISQAQAFLDGNKRTAFQTLDAFLWVNGWEYVGDPLKLARQFERFAERSNEPDEAVDVFEAWLRQYVRPRPERQSPFSADRHGSYHQPYLAGRDRQPTSSSVVRNRYCVRMNKCSLLHVRRIGRPASSPLADLSHEEFVVWAGFLRTTTPPWRAEAGCRLRTATVTADGLRDPALAGQPVMRGHAYGHARRTVLLSPSGLSRAVERLETRGSGDGSPARRIAVAPTRPSRN